MRTSSILHRAKPMLIALGIGMATGSPVLAQEMPRPGDAAQNGGAWIVQCVSASRTADPACRVSHRVFVNQTRQLLFAVEVAFVPGQQSPVMLITAPLGFHLPAGIEFSVDGKGRRTLQLQRCDQSGCYVALPLSAELMEAMRSGREMTLAFTPAEGQAATQVPIPLTGVSVAFDAAAP